MKRLGSAIGNRPRMESCAPPQSFSSSSSGRAHAPADAHILSRTRDTLSFEDQRKRFLKITELFAESLQSFAEQQGMDSALHTRCRTLFCFILHAFRACESAYRNESVHFKSDATFHRNAKFKIFAKCVELLQKEGLETGELTSKGEYGSHDYESKCERALRIESILKSVLDEEDEAMYQYVSQFSVAMAFNIHPRIIREPKDIKFCATRIRGGHEKPIQNYINNRKRNFPSELAYSEFCDAFELTRSDYRSIIDELTFKEFNTIVRTFKLSGPDHNFDTSVRRATEEVQRMHRWMKPCIGYESNVSFDEVGAIANIVIPRDCEH